MKHKIKLTTLVFAALFAGSLWLNPILVKAAAPSIYLVPSSTQTVFQRATVTVTIHEDSGIENINTAHINLNYPSSQLKIIQTSAASGWAEFNKDTSTDSTLLYTAFPTPNGTSVSGDNAVANIVFQAIGPGAANLSFGCNYDQITCPQGNGLTRSSDNSVILPSEVGTSVTIIGTLPVHRFYNSKSDSHFYTINQAEATYIYNNYYPTYKYEGVAFYALP